MKDKIIPILMVLGFSIFCGIISTVGGLGTLTSSLNRIAGPPVCRERQLEIEKDSSVYIQGEQTHQVTAYCVDAQTGDKQDVSLELFGVMRKLQLITGVIVALVVFVLSLSFLNWAAADSANPLRSCSSRAFPEHRKALKGLLASREVCIYPGSEDYPD